MNNKIKSLKMAGFTVPEIAKKLNTRRALNELDTIRSESCIKRMR